MAEATSGWMSELQSQPRPSRTVARDRNDSVFRPGAAFLKGQVQTRQDKATQGKARQGFGVLVLGGEDVEDNGKEKGKGCPNVALKETMSKRKSKGG